MVDQFLLWAQKNARATSVASVVNTSYGAVREYNVSGRRAARAYLNGRGQWYWLQTTHKDVVEFLRMWGQERFFSYVDYDDKTHPTIDPDTLMFKR